MSVNEEDFIPEELRDNGYGFCHKCGYPLNNWGAASRGDGDIFDEIGCDRCEEVMREEHASYCKCIDCDPYGLKEDDDEDEDDFIPCDKCDGHDACRDFGCAIEAGLGRMVKHPW